jgi:hypothetical protein
MIAPSIRKPLAFQFLIRDIICLTKPNSDHRG